MREMVLAVAVFAGACAESNSVQCDDGRYCPASTACVITTAGTVCVETDRVEACRGIADGEACGTAERPATCHGGACFDDLCGNALVDTSEVCDDGNEVADDDCSIDCQSTVECGNRYIDVVRGEECDTGDNVDHDGCSSDCRAETPRWELVNMEHPAIRSESTLVYDAKRQRSFLFGGLRTGTRLGDTWEWNGLVWSRRSSPVAPTPRSGHQMAYDAARDQVVLFSGRSSPADTWTWNGATWDLRAVPLAPRQRNGGAMVYDSKRGRTILFGGEENGTSLADTWEWDGTAWTQLMPALAPGARAEASVGYDAKRGVIVVFGGRNGTQLLGDTWELDGTTWTMKSSSGPSPRFRGAMAFDPATGRVTLVDGEAAGGTFPHEAWGWDGSQWQAFDNTAGPATPGAVMATDAVRGRLVLFDTAGNLWERGTAWIKSARGSLNPGPTQTPLARVAHVLMADTKRRELVLFGGGDTVPESLNELYGDTWVWNGQWRQQAATTGPSARIGAAAAFDPVRGEGLLFGGCAGDGSGYPGLADFWSWNGTAWSPRTGGPPKRCFAQMAFDTKRGRIVLHGGTDDGATLGDTWTWDGTSWHLEAVGLKRSQAAFGYDEDRDRMVLFGGRSDTGSLVDTWLWDGSAWSSAGPAALPPRRAPQMAWDRGRHRLVMHGGDLDDRAVPESWEWTGTVWELLTATEIGALELHAMTPAFDGAGVYSFAGVPYDVSAEEFFSTDQLWRLRWDGAASTERCEGTDADGDGDTGCLDPDCGAVCTTCGNGTCDPGLEQCTSCPADCGACAASCGDFVCASGETCAGDCP